MRFEPLRGENQRDHDSQPARETLLRIARAEDDSPPVDSIVGDSIADDSAADRLVIDDSSLAEAISKIAATPNLTEGLDLDDELDLLGGQLASDAAYLSRCYPGAVVELALAAEREAAEARRSYWARSARLRRWASCAAGVTAVAFTSWTWWDVQPHAGPRLSVHTASSPGRPSAGHSSIVNPSLVVPFAANAPVAPAAESPAVAASGAVEPPSPTTPLEAPIVAPQDFMDLDPAVREAVVDLVQEGELQQGSVSL